MILAEGIPYLGQTGQLLLGLVGLLTAAVLVLTFVQKVKSVFGKQPPMTEQLREMVKLLRGEIHREKNSALKEFKLKLEPVLARMNKAEEEIMDIQIDRERKWGELKNEMHAIANDVAYLRGIRKGEKES